MIAAMIQSPSYYTPDPKAGVPYQALVARWHYVINAMVGMGTLSPQDAAKAKFPTVVKPFNNNWGGYRGYIMQAVFNELEQTYGYTLDQINTKGLHIVTTFSKPLMDSLYATVNQNRALMKARHPARAGVRVDGGLRAEGLPAEIRPHRARCSRTRRTARSSPCTAGRTTTRPSTTCALQSRNQVGSSFKPYVLATAVKQGMNVQTSQLNGFSPLWIPPDADADDLRQPAERPGTSPSYRGAERRGGQPQPAGQRGRGDGHVAQHRLRRPLAPGGLDPTASTTSSTWPRRSGWTCPPAEGLGSGLQSR